MKNSLFGFSQKSTAVLKFSHHHTFKKSIDESTADGLDSPADGAVIANLGPSS
jgi:hypothetical protein